MDKPKVGFYWCASCGGCEEAVVDLAETILDVVEVVDIVFWPCAMDFKREDVEAMPDGTMAACFVNGAVRTSEQRAMAELCRRKSQSLVAFGSCAHLGGVPGLANLHSRQSILQACYGDGVFTTVNPDRVVPGPRTERPEGSLELPELDGEVKRLDHCVTVDYYLPGCPPPVKLIVDAVTAIVENKLPPEGTVLAPDTALCHDCPRLDSKPEEPFIDRFRRPHQIPIDPEKCFLTQGLLCLGPATRSGCDNACIQGNMPCTGCMGPLSGVRDQGAAALSAVASLMATNDASQADRVAAELADLAGTLYRYGMPSSLLFKKAEQDRTGGVPCPSE
ncbi:MAG TPA: oxidoreductase [Planctomycetes bacterium]|nr:oxidoreductase [Planctomycetota bacterium]